MRFKHKSKHITGLVSLVIVDDFQVQKPIKRILSSIEGNWRVVVCKNFYNFPKNKVGVNEDYSLALSVKLKNELEIATSCCEIYLATSPDNRGYYNAYIINNYLKHLKISVPVYRMNLPTIDDSCVSNAILKKDIAYFSHRNVLKYESRLALDRLIKYHTNEFFLKYIPVAPNLESCSAIILDFIESMSSKVEVLKIGDYVDFIQLKKNDSLSYDCSYRFKKLKKSLSHNDFMTKLGKYSKWVGTVKAIYELYAKGIISFPTNSSNDFVSSQHKYISEKCSNKKWGMYCINSIKDYSSLSDTARDVYFDLNYATNSEIYKETVSLGDSDLVFYPSHKIKDSVVSKGKKDSLGVSQKTLALFFDKICLPSKLWAYYMFSLVSNRLIVETSDTTYSITSLGKFILYIVKKVLPRLLNEKSIIKINKGCNKKFIDDNEYFDFVEDRWSRVSIELADVDENFDLPKVKSRCLKCNNRLSLQITSTDVYLKCLNNKCSNKDSIAISYNGNKIESKE